MSAEDRTTGTEPLPLEGIRVIEFSHMVMGPSCGMILADLGAEVIKIEPRGGGDKTRYLPGSGSGLFPAFNRNKRSVQLDIAEAVDRDIALTLIDSAVAVLSPHMFACLRLITLKGTGRWCG